jgi:hypothetical protein
MSYESKLYAGIGKVWSSLKRQSKVVLSKAI